MNRKEATRGTARSRFDQLPSPDRSKPRNPILPFKVDDTNQDRERRLTIEFFGQDPQIFNLSFMLTAPALAIPFAEALGHIASMTSKSARTTRIIHLRKGFFSYVLDENLKNLGLADLTTERVDHFTSWLHKRTKLDGELYSPSTLKSWRVVFITCVKRIRKSAEYAALLPTNLHFKLSPWNASIRTTTPTRDMNQEERDVIFNLCVKEVTETMKRVQHDWSEVERYKKHGLTSDLGQASPYKDIGFALHELSQAYPGKIPSTPEMKLQNLALYEAMQWAVSAHHIGFGPLIISLQPTPRALVPFILLLGFYLGYNNEVLLNLKLNDLHKPVILGEQRLRLTPYKERSGSTQPKTIHTDGLPYEPGPLFKFIFQWTARIRTVAEPEISNKVFIFCGLTRQNIRSFSNDSVTWFQVLKLFKKDYDIIQLTMREVRLAHIKLAGNLFNNDAHVRKIAAGHRTIDMQYQHYLDDSTREVIIERGGNILNTRDRYFKSNGVIDPRGRMAIEQDLGASTPGFLCLDPYDSPQLGQVKSRLCDAFGACPSCALAVVNYRSPESLLNLLQLKERIEQAQLTLPAPLWLNVWAPRLRWLIDVALPAFNDPDVLQTALTLTLPPLPSLEAIT